MRFTFKKHEHLKRKKTFAALFTSGKKVKRFPLLMVFTTTNNPEESPVQAGFSVSKRRFKHAVDRNRIKRQMREAYRLSKPVLHVKSGAHVALVFIYIHNKKVHFSIIRQAMEQCLAELNASN